MPITALLPMRLWTIALLVLSGATAIVSLAAAYGQAWLFQHCVPIPIRRLVDVGRSDSLAACLLAFFWLNIAAAGLLIFQIRRHRSDDYRGTYRLWLWVAIASLLVAVDQITHWRDAGSAAAVALLGWPARYAELYWQIPALVLGLGLLVRVVVEVRECPGQWVGYAAWLMGVIIATASNALTAPSGADMLREMLVFVSTGLGTLALWASILAYGRHVALEAEGVRRTRKPVGGAATQRASKQPEPATGRSEPNTAALTGNSPNLGPSAFRATIRRDASTPSPEATSENKGDQPDPPQRADQPIADHDRLSRSERKRLKKLQSKQRAAA